MRVFCAERGVLWYNVGSAGPQSVPESPYGGKCPGQLSGEGQVAMVTKNPRPHKNAPPAWRPYEDAEWLRQKYHGEQLLQQEIAAEVGVTPCTIGYWLNKHGIERRSGSETYLLRKQRRDAK
jgi:hypothetical protein